MAQNSGSESVEEFVDDEPSEDTPDIHPVVLEEYEDEDFEGGGRQPIDLSGEGLNPADLERLLRPKGRRSGRKDQGAGEAPAPSEAPVAPEESAEQVAESAALRQAELKAEIESLNDKYLRAVADLQNVRRRSEDEIRRIKANANERLIKEILPLVDDLDLCIDAAKKTESYEQLISGVEAIYRKFEDILSREGVQPVTSVGEPFNPDIHEAVMLDAESEHPDDTVTDQLRKGYTMHGRLIRPALVKVAKS